MRIAHLDTDAAGLAALREAFRASNPDHDLTWHPGVDALEAADGARLVFVQAGEPIATVGGSTSPLEPGAAVALRPGEALGADGPLDLLAFHVPSAIPADLPTFLRPDHDPQVTDTPGGCAEEERAYRRVLVTWEPANGPYVWRAINCHRVRMWNSFSHYHPADGGFDELYLVQGAEPDARLYTSEAVARIEDPAGVQPDEADALVDCTPLANGDLVWIPRGTMHRAVGGALAHVITVPGFVPQREYGLDHHLRAIAERTGRDVPFQSASSTRAVVK